MLNLENKWLYPLFTLISIQFILLNFNDFWNIQEVKGTQNGGNPEDDLLEKSVENKSCLKLNFKQLLFSILFSRRLSLGLPSFRVPFTS